MNVGYANGTGKEIGWNCIQGCKEYGVETENPEEIERLVKERKADA